MSGRSMARGLTPPFEPCLIERALSRRDEGGVLLARLIELAGELAERPLDVQEGRRRDLAEHRSMAAPLPIDRFLDHPRSNRVENDVPLDMEAVPLVVDARRAEPALEQVPDIPVAPVERLRVLPVQELHPARDRGRRHVDHEMHVIAHQAVRDAPPAELARHLAEQDHEPLPIEVVHEDGLRPVAATPDVPQAFRLIAELARHRSSVERESSRKSKERAATCAAALVLSGCRDSNSGPLRPERSALPGCATPRTAP